MYLQNIALRNFRNFTYIEKLSLPREGLLLAAAPNAVGKTNFLESISVLLRGKSFRASMGECVAWGKDGFILQAQVGRIGVREATISVRYDHAKRLLKIEEDAEPASLVTFYAHYPFVVFLPEDAFLFTRGPALRRSFINQVLVSQPQYLSVLVQYHRVLRQRNKSLKMAQVSGDVAAWTDLLAEHAEVLWRYREQFAAFISSQLPQVYTALSGEDLQFQVKMMYGVHDPSLYKEALYSAFSLEKRYGYTQEGPHRDDLLIEVSGRSVKSIMSRGQMRSLVVALKVVAHKYLEQVTGEVPVLLLDDVLSEMDEHRQSSLLSNLPRGQTLVTCTSVPSAVRKRSEVNYMDLRKLTA